MPGRGRKNPPWNVALSVESAAIALQVPARWLRAQIAAGLGPRLFDMGGKRQRVLVCELIDFVRSRKQIFKRSKKHE